MFANFLQTIDSHEKPFAKSMQTRFLGTYHESHYLCTRYQLTTNNEKSFY